MSVTIRVREADATLRRGRWRSDDEVLLKLLRDMPERYPRLMYEPDPDLLDAERAVEWLGGEILEYTAPEIEPGRVY